MLLIDLAEIAIATTVALLQAAERAAEASPEEFLELLLEDRAAGIEPQRAILRLVKGLARDQARGVATQAVAQTCRELALAELVETLATIRATQEEGYDESLHRTGQKNPVVSKPLFS
jgi:hypothetical protein